MDSKLAPIRKGLLEFLVLKIVGARSVYVPDILRRLAGTWVAKILFALLVLSFAVWGIEDVVRNFGRTTAVAHVSGEPIELTEAQATARREMARIYREAEAGKRDTAEASKLTFMLGQIGKILELTQIERRLDALEDRTHV